MINAFRGRYTKLSNYSSCVVFYEGHAYQSVEHAYQAQKTIDAGIQKQIRDCATPAVAKRVARGLKYRADWEEIRRKDWEEINIPLMLTLLREKFSQEPERSILLSTGTERLVEGNWWHDNFWGDCTCGSPDHPECVPPGENWLGKSLEVVRGELKRGHMVPASETSPPRR